MLKRGLFVFVFINSISNIFAADYYVSPTGSATWSQSADINTSCSLDTANSHVRAGDKVYLKAGEYGTYIAPLNTGKSDLERITYLRQVIHIV